MSDGLPQADFVAHWVTGSDRHETLGRRHAAASLLARAALRALLAHQTGRSDWRIVRSALGKPYVVDPRDSPGPAVSLSHTAGMVAVALATDGSLGIDVERHRPRNVTALAAQAFGAAERAAVAAGGTDAFYRIWTLREAIAKATGEGLAVAGSGRDLLTGLDEGAEVHSDHAGRTWQLDYVRLAADMSLAVAHADASGEPGGLRWITLAADGQQ